MASERISKTRPSRGRGEIAGIEDAVAMPTRRCTLCGTSERAWSEDEEPGYFDRPQ